MTLSDILTLNRSVPAWSSALVLILLWWGILAGLRKFMIRQRIRPARVVILTQGVLSLAGTVFVFNILFVPVVLIAFHGMALFSIMICTTTAVLYLIRVNDKDSSGKGTASGKSYPDDRFIRHYGE